MGTINSQGVYVYDNTNSAPDATTLNLQSSALTTRLATVDSKPVVAATLGALADGEYTGQLGYATSTEVLYIWDGSSWKLFTSKVVPDEDSGWVNCTMAPGFTSTPLPQVRKIGNTVFFTQRANITGTIPSGGSGTSVVSIPVGYRPGYFNTMLGFSGNNPLTCYAASNGLVTVRNGTGTSLSAVVISGSWIAEN